MATAKEIKFNIQNAVLRQIVEKFYVLFQKIFLLEIEVCF